MRPFLLLFFAGLCYSTGLLLAQNSSAGDQPEIPTALNTPGWTWTVTPQNPAAAWYPDSPRATDNSPLSDQNVLRTGGGAYLETTLTGPGLLHFEAALSPLTGNVYYNHALQLRLLPPVTPNPLPAPVYSTTWIQLGFPAITRSARVNPVAQAWIPAGTWRARFEADGPAVLNNVQFSPALSGTQITAALDLPAGLTATTDAANPWNGGAVPAALAHDGEDAITLVPGNNPGTFDQQTITFAFNGPAVLSGWILGDGLYSMNAAVNGKIVGVPLEAAWTGWRPFRLPVTTTGPVTVELSVGFSLSLWQDSRPMVSLDEFTLTPLTPVPLAEALDAPGLTWTASPDSWTGWASGIASPDATDAAWWLHTMDTAPPTPLWLETALTGPGVLRFQTFGDSGIMVQVSGSERLPEQTSTAVSRWVESVYYIPPGPQTVRLSILNGLTGLDNVRLEQGGTTTLQAALDLPAAATLTTTGGDWIATTIDALTHDGTDAVMLRAPFTNPSTLEVPVTGPSVVSWWSRSDGFIEWNAQLDGKPLRVDGSIYSVARRVPVPDAPERAAPEWFKEEIFVPAGTHALRWTARQGDETLISSSAVLLGIDELTITPLPAPGISLAEAIDQPGWNVTTTRPDRVLALPVPGGSFDGTDAVLVNGTGEEVQPALRASVSGPGLLYYRWRPMGLSTGQVRVWLNGESPSAAETLAEFDSPWRHSWLWIPPGGPHDVAWSSEGGGGHGILVDNVALTPTIPLGTATGAESLAWTTGGDLPWVGLPFPGDPASITFAPRILPGQSSWIETTVTGPGRLTYKAEGPHTISFDGLALHSPFNTTLSPGTLIVPPGTHQVRWSARFDERVYLYSNNYLSTVKWTPSTTPDPVAEALDAPHLPWFFAGTGDPWQPQVSPALDGVDSLHWNQSGGSSWAISTVVPGPGTAWIRAQATGAFAAMVQGKPLDGDWSILTLPLQTDGPQVFTFQINYSTGPGRVDIDKFEWMSAAVTLAEGMDAPGPWITSPDKPWTGVAFPAAHDASDAVMAGSTAAGAWMETTVAGPTRIKFFARGTGGFLQVDGGPRIPGDSANEWRPFIMELPAGSHTLHWESTGGEYTVDQFSVTPLTISLAEALDHDGPWLVPDPNPWMVSTGDSSDGSDAALLSGQADSTTLVLPVNGPGRLEFMARALLSSNHADVEHEVLVTRGTTLLTAHFTGDWQPLSTQHVPPGTQQLLFSLPGGYAAQPAPGFDQVRYTPYAEVPLGQALEGTGGVTFTTSPVAQWKGYAAGTGAYDGIDAASVSGDRQNWLDITVPAGAGELSFYAMRAINSPELLNDGRELPVPAHWKRIALNFAADAPRRIRLSIAAGSAWLDRVAFLPSTAALQTWLAAQGLPANADLNSDTDRDGQPLLMEWALGLDPQRNGPIDYGIPPEAAQPVFQLVPRFSGDSSVLTLACRYARRTGVPGLLYDVEFSTATDTGWQANGFDASGLETVEEWSNDWEIITKIFPGDENATPPKVFGRLRVTWAP